MKFYVGLHQPSDAKHFDRCCISVNRLRNRQTIIAHEVLLDSGAFTELNQYGRYRHEVADYAAEIRRLAKFVPIAAAVSQDYMCEPFITAKTGLTVADHQRLTIERYDALLAHDLPVTILPVLQGWGPNDYRHHVQAYGTRLAPGQWVGVGSVCKRNGSAVDMVNVLSAIATERPDLRLHGFGVKFTSLRNPSVRSLLYSADSMAWSFAARREGRNGNDWREAKRFERQILSQTTQPTSEWQTSFDFSL